jgi:hypothetical protein
MKQKTKNLAQFLGSGDKVLEISYDSSGIYWLMTRRQGTTILRPDAKDVDDLRSHPRATTVSPLSEKLLTETFDKWLREP